MAKAKLTPEQWAEARREWEMNPTASYASVAGKFLISKALVGQRAASEKWQRGIGVASHPKDTTAQGNSGNLQDCPSTRPMDARLDASDSPNTRPAHVVAEAFVPPTAEKTPANDYADEIRVPAGLDELDREEFVKAAIVARQRAINARHLKELNAARSKLYESIRKAGTKEGAGNALASQRNIAALIALQAAEMDAELQRVKLEVAEFVGKPMKPTPARIVVHMQSGEQLLPVAALYGRNAIEVTDVIPTENQNEDAR